MIRLILGAFTLGLGLKRFSFAGLPWSKGRNLTGTKARVIGGIWIALARMSLLDGLPWIGRMAPLISRAVREWDWPPR